MSARELQSWQAFWEEHPFDDDARFFRPFALLASQNGADYEAALRWAKRQAEPLKGWIQADLNTFAALGVKPPGR